MLGGELALFEMDSAARNFPRAQTGSVVKRGLPTYGWRPGLPKVGIGLADKWASECLDLWPADHYVHEQNGWVKWYPFWYCCCLFAVAYACGE